MSSVICHVSLEVAAFRKEKTLIVCSPIVRQVAAYFLVAVLDHVKAYIPHLSLRKEKKDSQESELREQQSGNLVLSRFDVSK